MLESEDWKRPDSASITICVMDSVYDDFDVIKSIYDQVNEAKMF